MTMAALSVPTILRANQGGGGNHVASCGYMTAADAAGRGIARAMCQHSLHRAQAAAFARCSSTWCVSTNERAFRLWTSMGFEIVGRLPLAFVHPTAGSVDALVMHRALEPVAGN